MRLGRPHGWGDPEPRLSARHESLGPAASDPPVSRPWFLDNRSSACPKFRREGDLNKAVRLRVQIMALVSSYGGLQSSADMAAWIKCSWDATASIGVEGTQAHGDLQKHMQALACAHSTTLSSSRLGDIRRHNLERASNPTNVVTIRDPPPFRHIGSPEVTGNTA